MDTFILVLFYLFWYLLIFIAINFIVSGLDDLFFDVYYWVRFFLRKLTSRKYSPLTYEKLCSVKEKKIAVMLPCWQEANVIPTMLHHNCNAIDYGNYHIFVGVYPNDPETIDAVLQIERLFPQVHAVIGNKPGPTNKASNLNEIYQAVKNHEREDQAFDIYVFHDSEDIIHPLSFKLYNYLMPRKDMIQIPVFPLETKLKHFTHWVYCDEFCENHTKDIVVRESIKGLVPSAGVGTAFTADTLKLLALENGGAPFQLYSLTEDYKTSLSVRLLGLKQIFVFRSIVRTVMKRHWLFWGKYRAVKTREIIATRALFPMEYYKSVRQKARWVTGISIQEWIHTGWVGNFPTLYTLLHDRKSIGAHFINMLGYIVFLFWLIYYLLFNNNLNYPNLQEQLNLHPWVWYLIISVTLLMCNRVAQRVIACYRIYGVLPAMLSIPRIFYGNIINFHSLLRAFKQILFHANRSGGKNIIWDKTEHQFPGSHVLIPYKHRLGDLLVKHHHLTQSQLDDLIVEQQHTGTRLGELLKQKKIITESQLLRVLSKQYKLPLYSLKEINTLARNDMPGISFYNYFWMKHYHVYPIAYDFNKKTMTVGISDPSNEHLIKQLIHRLKPYTLDFVLIDPV